MHRLTVNLNATTMRCGRYAGGAPTASGANILIRSTITDVEVHERLLIIDFRSPRTGFIVLAELCWRELQVWAVRYGSVLDDYAPHRASPVLRAVQLLPSPPPST